MFPGITSRLVKTDGQHEKIKTGFIEEGDKGTLHESAKARAKARVEAQTKTFISTYVGDKHEIGTGGRNSLVNILGTRVTVDNKDDEKLMETVFANAEEASRSAILGKERTEADAWQELRDRAVDNGAGEAPDQV